MDGKQLWHTPLGKESDPARWGTSSSPILYQDNVIVTASCESQAIVALDKKTGKEVWRKEAKGTDNLWGTPILAETKDGIVEIVVAVAGDGIPITHRGRMGVLLSIKHDQQSVLWRNRRAVAKVRLVSGQR